MNDKFKAYTIEATTNFPGHVCPECGDLLPETSQISASKRAQVTGLRAEVRQLTDEELLAVPGSAGKIAADVFCTSPLCDWHEVAFVSLDVAIAAALGWAVSIETPTGPGALEGGDVCPVYDDEAAQCLYLGAARLVSTAPRSVHRGPCGRPASGKPTRRPPMCRYGI